MWIRGILILTCTLVSFFHGSNDGQKGMGLIMLILIGVVPTAYALNRSLPESQICAATVFAPLAVTALDAWIVVLRTVTRIAGSVAGPPAAATMP